MSESVASTAPANEPGHLLSWTLIGILVAFLVAIDATGFEPGPIKPGLNTVLLGLYLMAWGFMFLASYYYSHKSFFLRGLLWVCLHFSFPPGKKMAFFYFGLALLMGGLAVIKGLDIA